MGRGVAIGIGVAAVVVVLVIVGTMPGIVDIAAPLDTANYKKIQADAYEFEIPSDWQHRPRETDLDRNFDSIIEDATGHRVYDNQSDEYAKQQSLFGDAYSVSIVLHTAQSDLDLNEYGRAVFDVMAAFERNYGVDIEVLYGGLDTLDGRPAITMEYVIGDPADPGTPALRGIEAITIDGSSVYSVAYWAEPDDYGRYLHHFQHAVDTFVLK